MTDNVGETFNPIEEREEHRLFPGRVNVVKPLEAVVPVRCCHGSILPDSTGASSASRMFGRYCPGKIAVNRLASPDAARDSNSSAIAVSHKTALLPLYSSAHQAASSTSGCGSNWRMFGSPAGCRALSLRDVTTPMYILRRPRGEALKAHNARNEAPIAIP
jgi:hypothetical protein